MAQFTGLHLLQEFITEDEEMQLVSQIEADPNWKDSQSGRRKIDYGPTANFKRKKLKVGSFRGLPSYSKQFIFDKLDAIKSRESCPSVEL